MLTDAKFKKYNELLIQIGEIESDCIDHVEKILYMLAKELKWGEIDLWFFEGAPEGDIGDIDIDDIRYTIWFLGPSFRKDSILRPMFEGCSLEYTMPTRFLFMTIEDIKKEVCDFYAKEKKKAQEKREKSKKARLAKKVAKEKLLNNIRNKLTKEELKIIMKK